MGFLQRGLLLYLFLALVFVFAAPQYIFNGDTPAENTVLSWFNIQLNQSCVSSGTTDYSSCITTKSSFSSSVNATTSAFTTPTSPAQSGNLLGFLDPVFQVFGWIGIFFKTIFSPIILFTSPAMAGAPAAINLLFAIPITFLLIVGLIIWIRSGFT